MRPSLRVMSANLWAEHVDAAALATVIATVDPDVLAVQELQPPAAAVVADLFPHHGLAPHHATAGTGIALRHPATIARLPLPYRSGWSATLEPPHWPGLGGPLRIVNVHLANPVEWPWWRSIEARRRQALGLEHHLADADVATMLVGDMNATTVWPLYRRLTRQLVDGPLVAGTAERTWRYQGRGPRLMRIDHALVRGVQVVCSMTVEVPGADHLGLVVDVAGTEIEPN